MVTLNLIKRRVFPTTPKNVAKVRDFNRIESTNLGADHLESQLALFENTANEAIRNIERTDKFEGEDRIVILNLIALFSIRNPYRREYWRSIQNYTTQIALSIAAANVGRKVNGVLITEELKNIITTKQLNVGPHQNALINLELSVLDTVIKCLLQRNWILIRAEKGNNFISCDKPVVLIWKDDKPYVNGPGFGSPNSQVYFPLTKSLALMGDFESEEGVIIGSERLIATVNSLIFTSAALWVYTETLDFLFLKHTGEIGYGITAFWSYLEPLTEEI